MKKRLSTFLTFFWKFILPIIWLLMAIYVVSMAHTIYGSEAIIFSLGYCLGAFIIYYAFARSKRVHIDDRYLYVDNFRKSIKVPLRNVAHVSENMLLGPRIIFVKFREETAFGKEIMFVGYITVFLFMSSHPAAKKIKFQVDNL